MEKNNIRTFFNTVYKNNLKMDQCNSHQNVNFPFWKIWKTILNSHGYKKPRIAKAISKRKDKVGVLTLIQWHKERHTDQWNRTVNPEIHHSIYGQLIFTRVPK